MKIIKTVEIFNDEDVKIELGQYVTIETEKGVYKGIVKSIKQNCLSLVSYCDNSNDSSSISIAYKNILKFN